MAQYSPHYLPQFIISSLPSLQSSFPSHSLACNTHPFPSLQGNSPTLHCELPGQFSSSSPFSQWNVPSHWCTSGTQISTSSYLALHLTFGEVHATVFEDIKISICYFMPIFKIVWSKLDCVSSVGRIPLHSPLSQNGLAVPMHDDSIPHWHCFNEDSQCSPGLSSAHSWSQALSSYSLLDSK